ncbi:MAG: type II toxin-antitoxin system HicB family antitoxin [Lachnospiraceae bacterium]|nr:type II toxin-antitoxin system HicB family antitoxin [Lachnospiraceae bacterium]
MVLIYPVVFTQTHDSKDTYLINIPDLKGFTEGFGIEDAYSMARDYIGSACFDKEDSMLPKPSNISEIVVSETEFAGNGDSFVSLVDVDLDAYRQKVNNRAVRRNVSIPGWLNQAADEANLNVSRILQDALMETLKIAK